MAKDDKKELAKTGTNEMSTPGAAMPADFQEYVLKEGFKAINTLMVGDPTKDRTPFYVGRLVGPGKPVMVETPDGKESEMPTWIFAPMVMERTETGVLEPKPSDRVTHVVPAPYQVHAACARIWEQAEATSKTAVVAIAFEGRETTAKGKALNVFNIYEKYLDKGAAAPALAAVK